MPIEPNEPESAPRRERLGASNSWNPFDRPDGEQTAPRPHPVTILIGFLSPLLAIVALSLSWLSYHFSLQNNEINQRAYLSIQFTKVSIAENLLGRLETLSRKQLADEQTRLMGERHLQKRDACIFTVNVETSIINSGNTPAAIESAEREVTEFRHCDGFEFGYPDRQGVQKISYLLMNAGNEVIQKDSLTQTPTFDLSADAFGCASYLGALEIASMAYCSEGLGPLRLHAGR